MNYFRRIIHKTIGPVHHSLRPGVTPESIPETPHALAAKQDTPAGKNIVPANGNFTPHARSAPIENNKEAPSHVKSAAAAGEAEENVEAGLLPKEPQPLPSPANLVSSNRPLEKSTPLQPEPIEPPSKEPELFSVNNSDDAYEKPRPAVAEQSVVKPRSHSEESTAQMEENETPPEPSPLDEPQFLGGKESKSNDKLDVESLPQEDSIAPRQAVPSTSPNADLLRENRQDTYSPLEPTSPSKTLEPTSPSKTLEPTSPSKTLEPTSPSKTLEPTSPSKMRYSAPTHQPEETVVMINIGRIEIKAEPASKPAPRLKFSPALSLADYLKQRSEGKIG
jgi:hypothetical protein